MNTSVKDYIGISLIILCSILLGIWATIHTIALRNILLVGAGTLSVIYLSKCFKEHRSSLVGVQLWQFDPLRWLPSSLIVAMFVWVILHYLLFSQFPEKQWDELASTWLRAFLAAIIGFACASVLRRNPSYVWLLWLGLIASFLVLVYQYIPKAISNRSLFAPDYYGSYIYFAKFSGVLAGIILFAGTLGLLIDSVRQLLVASGGNGNEGLRFNRVIRVSVGTLGLLLPIYSFVLIFGAKNGVGVSALLLIFWFMVGGIYLWIQFFGDEARKQSGQKWTRWIIIYPIILMTFSWFAYLHAKNSPGWESLIEDIRIAIQIEKYQHWQSPKDGLPKRADGSSVAGNTYERAALATVGLMLILDNPIGSGVLRALPSQMRAGGIEYDHYSYTHSAWIDLGLSYGWPGIVLIPTALLLCLIACIKGYRGPYRATVASLAVSFLILYLVGEYGFQHGIEILLFICALLAGLIFPTQKRIHFRYPVQ